MGAATTLSFGNILGSTRTGSTSLTDFSSLPASQLEMTERLEQLRLLDNGISIYVEPVELNTIGVDTEADLKMASAALAQLAEERRVP